MDCSSWGTYCIVALGAPSASHATTALGRLISQSTNVATAYRSHAESAELEDTRAQKRELDQTRRRYSEYGRDRAKSAQVARDVWPRTSCR